MDLSELVERYRIATGDVPPWLDLPVEVKHLEVIAACFYRLVQVVEKLELRAVNLEEGEGEDQAGRLH